MKAGYKWLGAKPKQLGYFYKQIILSTLLYGAKTWMLTNQQMALLRTFHYRVACTISKSRLIVEKGADLDANGNAIDRYNWPETAKVLDICGIAPIEEYIRRHKATLMCWVESNIPDKLHECQYSDPSPLNANQIVWWPPPNGYEYEQDGDDALDNGNNDQDMEFGDADAD